MCFSESTSDSHVLPRFQELVGTYWNSDGRTDLGDDSSESREKTQSGLQLADFTSSGRGRIRTCEGKSQLIYSRPRLTASVSTHKGSWVKWESNPRRCNAPAVSNTAPFASGHSRVKAQVQRSCHDKLPPPVCEWTGQDLNPQPTEPEASGTVPEKKVLDGSRTRLVQSSGRDRLSVRRPGPRSGSCMVLQRSAIGASGIRARMDGKRVPPVLSS